MALPDFFVGVRASRPRSTMRACASFLTSAMVQKAQDARRSTTEAITPASRANASSLAAPETRQHLNILPSYIVLIYIDPILALNRTRIVAAG
ncbi:hypothetical protein [Pannonibacter sp. SL95]|uniref:hypothetical protein n=1 Tax=Pannonibacter sp. SL95 TaxID=2995153 RepID=UPI002274C791|nr:hypothetical protein [Pannonibacter sp. SL95]MCY1708782.1 hypothetical protein [Pannonibacter sp. SL95]